MFVIVNGQSYRIREELTDPLCPPDTRLAAGAADVERAARRVCESEEINYTAARILSWHPMLHIHYLKRAGTDQVIEFEPETPLPD